MRRADTVILLSMLLVSLLSATFSLREAKASGTIYIRADGSIDPPTAPIATFDDATYTFTDDIANSTGGIVVERSNIVVDGAGHMLHGSTTVYSYAGITLDSINNVTIKGIQISYYDSGILLRNSSHNTITENDVVTNIDGIYVTSAHNTITGNNVTASQSDGILVGSHNNVSGNNVTGNSRGIWLMGPSSQCTVTGNYVRDSSIGVCVTKSSNNSICGNSIVNNDKAIYIYGSSSSNSISENTITDNGEGVYLSASSGNSILGNTFANNGLRVWESYQNSVENNTINGKPLIYLEGVSNLTVNTDAGQVILVDCNEVRVENLSISHTDTGIQLWDTQSTKITNNTVAHNLCGIGLGAPGYPSFNNNSIWANSLMSNDCGVSLYYSSNNKIYHNNFLNNTSQVDEYRATNVWHDGYPSGGNYWSDCAGVDLKNGPNQDVSGSDGIGDTPYAIDFDSKDRYPLIMKAYPWGAHDIGITALEASKTVVGQGYPLLASFKLTNHGYGTECFNVTVYANATIIEVSEGITLPGRNSITITMTWNTDGLLKGNYTMSVMADAVPGETDPTDNQRLFDQVLVTMGGDVNGDRLVGIFDIVLMANAYGEPPIGTLVNLDIDGDGDIDIFDIVIAAGNYGKSW